MLFRKTELADIDRVMEIVAQARITLTQLNVDQWQYGYPLKETFEQDCLKGNSYVVERSDGLVIATAMLGLEGEAAYDHIDGEWLSKGSSQNPTYAVLHRVTTCCINKTKDTGSYLFCCVENLVLQQGLKSVRIDTHENNIPMKKLLAKKGYHECGVVYLDSLEEGSLKRVGFEKLL